MNGFLILDKPKGPTSQQVLSKIKKILQIKKLGHTGTLDPLATGVLPIALGEATKVITYLDESLKIYEVEAELGSSTDTYDVEGKNLERADPKHVSEEKLREKLNSFLGEQEQIPPIFSAIKFQGKPLYAYARKGQEAPLKPRRISIAEIQLKLFQNPRFSFRVSCSRGTYVRSLVHDLGKALGCFAHVREIRRLQTGIFTLEKSVSLAALSEAPERVLEHLRSIEDCLPNLPRINLESESEYAKVISGAVVVERIQNALNQQEFMGKTVALEYQGLIVALVKNQEEGGMKYLRVLNRVSLKQIPIPR